MASLTETAYYARQTIKYGAIGIVSFIVLRALLLAGIAYYRRLHPSPPPPPTVAFGKLPKIVFPDTDQPVLNHRLETVTGTTPDLGDRAKVFFMPVRQANLLALQRMTSLVAKLGFKNEPEQLTPRQYRWIRDTPLQAILTADVVSGSFSMEVAWQQDPTLLTQKNLPNEAEAIQEARSYLSISGLAAEDLTGGAATVTWLKADIDELKQAVSLSEAEFVRVDFFRNSIEELTVYPPNPERGVVSVVFSGVKVEGKRVVDLKYNYFPVNYDESATYPIKPSAIAWAELQNEEGYVAKVDEDVDEVVVRRISLGYYDSAIPQHYLQPIYVFEGDGNFVGFVPAIDSIWVE